MSDHPVEDFQRDIGQSGHFGEVFVGLGILILVGGIILTGLGGAGVFDAGPAGDGGSRDSLTVGILFAVEGLGFIVFGAFAILSGWDRHHDHED